MSLEDVVNQLKQKIDNLDTRIKILEDKVSILELHIKEKLENTNFYQKLILILLMALLGLAGLKEYIHMLFP